MCADLTLYNVIIKEKEATHTTMNSLLSTISFPSASNMLKAILKPAWGSRIWKNNKTSSASYLNSAQEP